MVSRWFKSCVNAVVKPRRTASRPGNCSGTVRPWLEGLEERAVPANIHLVGDLSFNATQDTLTVEGKLAGLGNKDIKITVDAEGTALFDVRNPAGNEAPGITKKVSGTNSIIVESDQIDKNGTYNFSIDVTIDPGTVDLPNSQWTATLNAVNFETVTITVTQFNGKTVDLGTFDVTF